MINAHKCDIYVCSWFVQNKTCQKLHKKIIVLLVSFIHESSRYEYSHYVITWYQILACSEINYGF